MKPLLLGLTFLAAAYGVNSSEYQIPHDSLAVLEEIETLGQPPHGVSDEGYRYKTVRRFRSRHRRDVSELSPEYLPPNQEVSYQIPSSEYLASIAPSAPFAQTASGVLADDGYRYKTVRRSRLRHRRDVSELASTQYLPPNYQLSAHGPSDEYLAPIAPASVPVADIPIISSEYLDPFQEIDNILADDGYHYKTVRRFKIRRH